MKKIKLILFLGLLFMVGSLTSCFRAKPQEFSSHGMTVTLTSDFRVATGENVQFFLQTNKIGFAGNQEFKDQLGLRDHELERYTKAVLTASNYQDAQIQNYDDGENNFMYAYYTASPNMFTYKYMLVTKEGQNAYYCLNFWTLEKDFDKYQDQIFEWAKTIKVE